MKPTHLLYIPCALALFVMAPVLARDGWVNLISGDKFDNWRSTTSEDFPTRGWTLKDGILTVHATGGEESGGGGDFISRERYANFELLADFKTTPGANSGIKIFVEPNISPVDKITGIQHPAGDAFGLDLRILDDERHPDAKLGRD